MQMPVHLACDKRAISCGCAANVAPGTRVDPGDPGKCRGLMTVPLANRSCWKHVAPYPQARDPQAAAMGRCSRDYCMEIGAAAAPAGLPSSASTRSPSTGNRPSNYNRWDCHPTDADSAGAQSGCRPSKLSLHEHCDTAGYQNERDPHPGSHPTDADTADLPTVQSSSQGHAAPDSAPASAPTTADYPRKCTSQESTDPAEFARDPTSSYGPLQTTACKNGNSAASATAAATALILMQAPRRRHPRTGLPLSQGDFCVSDSPSCMTGPPSVRLFPTVSVCSGETCSGA